MRLVALAPFLLLLPLPALAASELPDWPAVAEVGTIEVETVDADGSERDTTIWLAVVDGRGYIRTGDTRWGANLERDPDLGVEIEDHDYALRVEFVEDDALRARIEAAFNEKYGWTDSLMGWFRGSRPKIMRLVPRPE